MGIDVGGDLAVLEGRRTNGLRLVDGQGPGVEAAIDRGGLAAIKSVVNGGSCGGAGDLKLEGAVPEAAVGGEFGVGHEGPGIRFPGIGSSRGRIQEVTGGPASQVDGGEAGLQEEVPVSGVDVHSVQGEHVASRAQTGQGRGGAESGEGDRFVI